MTALPANDSPASGAPEVVSASDADVEATTPSRPAQVVPNGEPPIQGAPSDGSGARDGTFDTEAELRDEASAPDEAVATAQAGRETAPAVTGARLAERFPALFAAAATTPNGRPSIEAAKPIKLRIHVDIQARAPGEFSKRQLGIFFARYTTTTAYLKALVTAPSRFDLDGEPAGEIAEEHRQAAREELDRRRAIAQERRTAMRRRPASEHGPKTEAAPDARAPIHATHPPPRPAGDARRDADHTGERRRAAPDGPRNGREPARPHPPHRRGPDRHAPRENARFDREPKGPQPASGARPIANGPHGENADAALPMDPAQRERALLLRAYEATSLSKANFCALKRMRVEDFEAQVALAQAERQASRRSD